LFSLISFCFRWFRFISFSFRWFRFVSFRFCWFRFVSFRFVSFRFVFVDFVSFRFVSFRFYFVSHFIGTLELILFTCLKMKDNRWLIINFIGQPLYIADKTIMFKLFSVDRNEKICWWFFFNIWQIPRQTKMSVNKAFMALHIQAIK
jgi:hypothetical protein